MNNAIATFTAPQGVNIRVVMIDGQPWFPAADVCRALGLPFGGGIGSTTRHLGRLGPDEKRLLTGGSISSTQFAGTPSITAVSESGLYKLILRSDKPDALAFQDWVTREVLPSLRKNGGYIVGQEKVRTGEMSSAEFLARAVLVANQTLETLQAERDQLAADNAIMADELTLVTVDEWRALNHGYLDHSARVRLGQRATKLARLEGVTLGKQTRTVRRHGVTHEVSINVYPSDLLDRAAVALGMAAFISSSRSRVAAHVRMY